MLQTLIKALEAVPVEAGIVVLAAEGPAFSAGHDLAEMIDRLDDYYAELFGTCTRMMEGIHASRRSRWSELSHCIQVCWSAQ